MSSECASSDTEDRPAPLPSSSDPSWWSDSDGRRSARDAEDVEESPWWDSECEPDKQLLHSDSPHFSPNPCDEDSSASSFTPTWWSEPSSRQLSSSASEIKVENGGERLKLDSCGATGTEVEGSCDRDKIKLSVALKNHKRSREQSNVSNLCLKEPPFTKQKLEPPSPHADPSSVLQDLRRGFRRPLRSFLLFFTVDLLAAICDLTNTAAWERILEEPSLAGADGAWEEVTVREMYAFLAVVLVMRERPDVCFGAFWRDPPDQGSGHWPKDLMKRSRFFKLLQVLRLADRTDDCPAVEEPNQKAEPENHQTQSAYSEDSSPLKELKYVWDQLERIFKPFFSRFEFLCYSEIRLRDGEGFLAEIRNYMEISPPSCELSSDGTLSLPSQTLLEDGDVLNSGKSAPDETPCNGTRNGGSKRTEPSSANRGNASNLIVKKCEDGERDLDVPPNDLKPPISNAVHVRWQGSSLTVTSAKHAPVKIPSTNFPSGDGTIVPQAWEEVFIPCPELVYKDRITGTLNSSNSDIAGYSSSSVLARSFFYHYLHLAVYFSTSEDVWSLHSGSEEKLSASDSLQKVIWGLGLLGQPDACPQSDSETDTTEVDVSRDSTSTDDSGGEVGDDSKGAGPHKYVPARSRASRKCALCWSLHQEVRRVRMRCARCGWHLCVSRFRNCMEQAHRDKAIMEQLWDKDTIDVQSTSELIDSEKNPELQRN